MECGTASAMQSGWDYNQKQAGVTKGGWTCRFCQGGYNQKEHGCREVDIYSGDELLTLIMDAPPQHLLNSWTKDRVEYCKQFEPNEPRSNERPIRPDAGTRRVPGWW